MQSQAGTEVQAVRLDSKGWRLKNWVCDLPALPKAEVCCTPTLTLSNLIQGASKRCGIMLCVTFLLLSSVIFLHIFSTDLAAKISSNIGNGWRNVTGTNFSKKGSVPPFVLDSSDYSVLWESSIGENFVPLSSIKSSPTNHLDYYDVCLAVSIGDDGDRPNDEALPYPLVSRLTDALAEEALSSRKYWSTKETSKVQVLVGVDYGSVVCLIVRDTFANLPGVKVECRTFSKLEQGKKCGKLVVGSSKRFVPQVPQEWSQAVEWETRRLVDLDCADPSHQPPALPEKDWQPTVVTGFSSNHLLVGLLLLRSVGRAVRDGSGLVNVSVVVWALDVFNPEHQGYLDCVIDELNHEYGVKAEVRLFDWSAYPSWMRINETLRYFGGTGEYAWKAVMVHTVLRERGIVLWADAGDRFQNADSLFETLKGLNATGFACRNSDGNVYKWTHPLQLKYYRANIPEVGNMRNCEAAILGFTLSTYTEFARPWYDCSVTRQCIAPEGSDRNNHRQDQAALTVLGVLSKHPCGSACDAHPGLDTHMDNWGGDDNGNPSGTYPTKCYSDPL